MKPTKKCQGLTFFPIPEISDLEMVFGLDEEHYFNRHDLPEVPKEYENLTQSLFFNGGKLPVMHSKVEMSKANRYLNALLTSFAPAHEAKITTVAYALWLWTHPSALGE